MSITNAWLGPKFQQMAGTLLKDVHLPGIIEVYDYSSVLSYRTNKSSQNVSGGSVNRLVHTGRTEGHGPVKRGGTLPSPHKQRYTRMTFPLTFYYGRLLIPGPEQADARDPAGSYGDLLTLESEGLARDVTKRENINNWHDGSGRYAIVTDVTNQGSGILRCRMVFDEADQASGLSTLLEGMMISVVDASASTTATPVFLQLGAVANVRQAIIASVDETAKEIVLSAIDLQSGDAGAPLVLSGIEEGDAIVLCTQRDNVARTSSEMLEITSYRHCTNPSNLDTVAASHVTQMGMMGFASDTNVFGGYNAGVAYGVPLQGIDASTANSWWRAGIFENGGTLRSLDQMLMQYPVDFLAKNGAKWTATYCNYGQRRAFLSTFTSQRDWSNVMKLQGGYEALDFNGKPFIVDHDCPPGRMFFLDEGQITRHQTSTWFWIEDPNVLQRLPNTDAFQATLGRYSELAIYRRLSMSVLADLRDV